MRRHCYSFGKKIKRKKRIYQTGKTIWPCYRSGRTRFVLADAKAVIFSPPFAFSHGTGQAQHLSSLLPYQSKKFVRHKKTGKKIFYPIHASADNAAYFSSAARRRAGNNMVRMPCLPRIQSRRTEYNSG